MEQFAINWNEIWENKILKCREECPSQTCADLWQRRESAKKFWDMSQEDKVRINWIIRGTSLKPDFHILDIGAGPGTLSIPFAQNSAHVTAVEPAEGMINILREKIAEYKITNISIVEKKWEDVNVGSDLDPPFDIVIASFSLGMSNIKKAIEKMLDVSSRFIYLYWFAGETSWDIRNRILWSILHRKEYHIAPKSDVLYNVLYQMGIFPDIITFVYNQNMRFTSIKEAFDYFRPQYQVVTDQQESILWDYLNSNLFEENGYYILSNQSIRVKIWWEIDENKRQIIKHIA